MYTGARLLTILTEYVKANEDDYIEAIHYNDDEGLGRVLDAIMMDPRILKDDLAEYNMDTNNNCLLPFKVKIMEFMIALHSVDSDVFSEINLGWMIPLCDPRSPSLTILVLQFLFVLFTMLIFRYNLIEKDTDLLIVESVLAMKPSLFSRIKDLLTCSCGDVVSVRSFHIYNK